MKRFWRWMAALAALAILVSFVIHSSHGSPDAPRYVPLQSQPKGPFGHVFYDWDDDITFVDGKAWVFCILSRTNGHEYLYDVENRKALGELFNGSGALYNADQSKLLCEGRHNMNESLRTTAIRLLNKIFNGALPWKTNRLDTYWILDLRRNSAHSVGALSQIPGTGSRWKPSPDFRLGYNVPSNSQDQDAFYLCDLQEETFRRIKVEGILQGWWDERQVLIKTPPGDFVLYDVFNDKTSPFLDLKTIGEALKAAGVSNAPSKTDTISHWTGSNYDFMLVPGNRSWSRYTNTSFVFNIGRPIPSLTLVQTNFQFHWLGTFNADGTMYAFPGESGGFGKGGNGGVLLQDFRNGNIVTLVPPNSSGQYALPRFYKDSIIYRHNYGEIRRIKTDGSNDTPFFPLPENK